jgi:hypothetical protein
VKRRSNFTKNISKRKKGPVRLDDGDPDLISSNDGLHLLSPTKAAKPPAIEIFNITPVHRGWLHSTFSFRAWDSLEAHGCLFFWGPRRPPTIKLPSFPGAPIEKNKYPQAVGKLSKTAEQLVLRAIIAEVTGKTEF